MASEKDMAINNQLSRTQRQIALHIAAGMTDQQVARAMHCSVWTVRSHLRTATRRTGETRTSLAAKVYAAVGEG